MARYSSRPIIPNGGDYDLADGASTELTFDSAVRVLFIQNGTSDAEIYVRIDPDSDEAITAINWHFKVGPQDAGFISNQTFTLSEIPIRRISILVKGGELKGHGVLNKNSAIWGIV